MKLKQLEVEPELSVDGFCCLHLLLPYRVAAARAVGRGKGPVSITRSKPGKLRQLGDLKVSGRARSLREGVAACPAVSHAQSLTQLFCCSQCIRLIYCEAWGLGRVQAGAGNRSAVLQWFTAAFPMASRTLTNSEHHYGMLAEALHHHGALAQHSVAATAVAATDSFSSRGNRCAAKLGVCRALGQQTSWVSLEQLSPGRVQHSALVPTEHVRYHLIYDMKRFLAGERCPACLNRGGAVLCARDRCVHLCSPLLSMVSFMHAFRPRGRH